MHIPIQSLGLSMMQPNTPCSASGECGGSRSTLPLSAVPGRRRRVRFKSAPDAPTSEIESIIESTKRHLSRLGKPNLFLLSHKFFTNAEGRKRTSHLGALKKKTALSFSAPLRDCVI